MEFSSLEIYDFSGYRFYYGLGDRAYILVDAPKHLIDLNSLKKYSKDKIQALLRLTDPEVIRIHDNLEVRLNKNRVDEIVNRFPDYGQALQSELEKLSIFASNLRFYQAKLVDKIEEIMEDYSGTNYHDSVLQRRHFISRIISNFDKYIRLDELPLNWVNFIDLLCQVPTTNKIQVFNTWRSFLVLNNYQGSDYSSFYYKFSRKLLHEFESHPEVELVNLSEDNIDTFLNPDKLRIRDISITTNNPIRYI